MRELEIYIHIPFCVRKCAYCDFLSGPASKIVQEQYMQALINEIKAFPKKAEYQVSTVFFGGGTPSVLPAEWISRVMHVLQENFVFVDACEMIELETEKTKGMQAAGKKVPEITIECNPGTADREKLEAYRTAGINRISFGLQSAENAELAMLGRIHTWEDFLETYQWAREAGFENINVDLMSALPGQTVESWERTLRKVLALRPEHISAYSLIIEEGTPFYEKFCEDDERRAEGEVPEFLPSEEAEREMYRLTEQLLWEAGMHRYEISNYADAGRECRHNIGYWTGVEYVGFGLGASSLLNHTRYRNTESMEEYLQHYSAGEKIRACSELDQNGAETEMQKWQENQEAARTIREAELLTKQDEMEEFMFLGLRMMKGVSEAEFKQRFQRELTEVYSEILEKLLLQHLLVRENGRIFLSAEGIDLSNLVMAEFLF